MPFSWGIFVDIAQKKRYNKDMKGNESKNLLEILTKLGEIVDPVIKEILGLGLPRNFKDLTNYQIEAGGKRLRPAFLMMSCYLLGGTTKDAIYPAAGVEILHNYSLIIDDMIDDSLTRRGRPTVWKKYGVSIAECVGSFYVSSIFQSAQRSKNPVIVSEIFAETVKTVMSGEIIDILCERGGRTDDSYINNNRFSSVSKRKYLEMIGKKTAVLFKNCCFIGGVSANGNEKEVDFLRKYGLNIGMAFQIQDDILDIFGDEKRFGKKIGKDIMERKGGNIVILIALEKLNRKNKKELSDILAKNRILKDDVKKAISLIKKTDAEEKSYEMGKNYVRKAKKALEKLPQNKWNKTLEIFADFVIEREK